MEPYRARIPERLGLFPILGSWDGGSHRLPGDVVRFERAQHDDNSLFTDTDRGDKGPMPSTNLMRDCAIVRIDDNRIPGGSAIRL